MQYVSNLSNQMSSSSALIQKLLKAEEEAEQIITRARENRTKKLKEARQAAEEELLVYKIKEQSRFDDEMASLLVAASENESQMNDEDSLFLVKEMNKLNGDKTSNYLIDRVLDVRSS